VPQANGKVSHRSAVVHFWLSVGLGFYGVDRFYLNHWWLGALKASLALFVVAVSNSIGETGPPETVVFVALPITAFYLFDAIRAGLGKARDRDGLPLKNDPPGGLFRHWQQGGESSHPDAPPSPKRSAYDNSPPVFQSTSPNRTGNSSTASSKDAKTENLQRMLAAAGESEKPQFVIWGTKHAIVAFSGRCMVVRGQANKKGKVHGSWLADATTLVFYYADINAIDVRTLSTKVYLTILTPSFSGEYDHVKTDMKRAENLFMSVWNLGTARTPLWDSTDESPDNGIPMTREQYDSQKTLVAKLRQLVGESKSRGHADSSPPPVKDFSEQLQNLADLHSKGHLTDDEFAEAKKRILSGHG